MGYMGYDKANMGDALAVRAKGYVKLANEAYRKSLGVLIFRSQEQLELLRILLLDVKTEDGLALNRFLDFKPEESVAEG